MKAHVPSCITHRRNNKGYSRKRDPEGERALEGEISDTCLLLKDESKAAEGLHDLSTCESAAATAAPVVVLFFARRGARAALRLFRRGLARSAYRLGPVFRDIYPWASSM